jgi:hypothetical protein
MGAISASRTRGRIKMATLDGTSPVNDDRITGRRVLAHATERTINLDLTHNGLLGTETLNPKP